MTAYVVFIRDEMKDQAAYDRYLQLGVPTLAPFGGEILVANGAHEAFEGRILTARSSCASPIWRQPARGTPARSTKP
ncbi:DUF1330 domain-containing protein [Basfia succiniciproducens]|uniref:DUF1330 domain-containing protein n=1 Tax=Basfia succiniciproducens TaxID=653940 RepID=UPI003FCDF132